MRRSSNSRFRIALPLRLVSALFALSLSASGQDAPAEIDLPAAYDRAVRAIDSGNFDDGIAAVDAVLKKHATDGMELYGPVFGHFHYIKGILLIRKGNFGAAIEPLRVCYENFSNESLEKKVEGSEAEDKLPNRFLVHSLAQRAGCHLMLKQFADAAVLYEEALSAKEPFDPKISRPQTQINLATCYLHQPDQMEKGRDFLFDQLREGPWPDSIKRRILLTLGTEWSEKAPIEEVAALLLEQAPLIQRANPFERGRSLNPPLINLGALGLQAGEPLRALAWFQLVANPDQIIHSMASQIKAVTEMKVAPALEAEQASRIQQMNAEVERMREQLSPLLLGMGTAHFQIGSYSASRAAHLRLEKMGSGLDERPVVLHNLTVGAASTNDWVEVITFGEKFFDEFPDHSLKSAVARLMVEVLFIQGNYQQAYDVAIEVRSQLPEGEEIRDIPDFVVGAAAYHIGRFEEADLELEKYLKTYNPPKRKEPAEFYRAATQIKLARWAEAVTQLEAFLTAYPDSELRPSALHLASLAHLVTEDLESAESRARELQDRFPNAEEIPASHNVLGDILTAKGDAYEAIASSYLKAIQLVEDEGRGDPEVAGYSLRQLITTAAQAEDWTSAAGYFDAFTENYEDTSWKVDASLAALTPLVETDRSDEAVTVAVGLVNATADEASEELDQIFGSYYDFLKEHLPPEQVIEQLRNFPASAPIPSPALKSWLLTAEADTLIQSDPKANKAAIRSAMISLTALYETHGTQLSNFSLVKLARWNVETWGKEEEARKIYEFILKERPFGQALGLALIERAKIDAAKKDPAARASAMDDFQRALMEITEEEFQEEAVLGMGRLHSADEDYEAALAQWENYLDHRSWNKARPEANFRYAECLDRSDKKKEALKAYVGTYVNYAGHLDWSTRAYLRVAVLLKEADRDVDALKVLQDMLKRMGHHKHPGVDLAKKTFLQWREEYVAENAN